MISLPNLKQNYFYVPEQKFDQDSSELENCYVYKNVRITNYFVATGKVEITDDIPTFSLRRLAYGVRWWEDVLGNGNAVLYSQEILDKYKNTWE